MYSTITETWHKIKALLTGDLFLILLIFLVGLGSFGLGRLSTEQGGRVPLEVRYPERFGAQAADAFDTRGSRADTPASLSEAGGGFVASKNSDKYHYPWCPGAQRIKEANKITFTTRAEAEAAGYTPAANCEGL